MKVIKQNKALFTIAMVILLAFVIVFVVQDRSAIIIHTGDQTYRISQQELQTVFAQAQVLEPNVTFEQIQQDLAHRTLLVNLAKKNEVTLNQTRVDQIISDSIAQLEQTLTSEQYIQRIEQSGLTQDRFEQIFAKRITDELYIEAFLDFAVYQNIPVQEQQLQELFSTLDNIEFDEQTNQQILSVPEAVYAAHILICHEQSQQCQSELTQGQALTLTQNIYEQITLENFAQFAQEYSFDQNSAQFGGDLGPVTRGLTVAEFEQAAFATEIGEIIGPVSTPFGYHIIAVYDRQEAQTLTFDQTRGALEENIRQIQFQSLAPAYVAGIIDAAVIEYR
ncbi:MAG: peptidylprolyl isomerase [Candidatus Woesearchaeota archaeon]